LEFIICSSIFTKNPVNQEKPSFTPFLPLSSLPHSNPEQLVLRSIILNSWLPKTVLLLCGDFMEDYEVCFLKGPSLNSPNSFFCCRWLQAFGISIDAVCPGKKIRWHLVVVRSMFNLLYHATQYIHCKVYVYV